VVSVAKKKSSKKNGAKKRATKQDSSVWPLIVGIVLLVIIIAAILLITGAEKEYPTPASFKEASEAFRARGLSEIIIPDLAKDFISGEYTLKELEQRYPGYEEDILEVNELLKQNAGDAVAIVNGKSITRSELESQTSLLPEQYRLFMTPEQILDQMINEELLVQEAVKRGVEPSEEEIEESYQDILDAGNLTEELLMENLASYSLTVDDMRAMLTKQLTINKLLEEAVDKVTTVTEEDARAFYDENIENYAAPEQVTVRHILIATSEEKNAVAAREEAEGILARIEAGEDFCELALAESDDPGSKANCGEYTFGRGLMVAPFEEAAFEMSIDERRVVDTSFGSHVMLKMGHTKTELPSFEEVSLSIEEQLLAQKKAQGYQDFITSLREEATIQLFLAEKPATAEELALDLKEEISALEEPASETEIVEEIDEMIVEEMPAELAPEEPAETSVEETPAPVVEEPVEVTVIEGEQPAPVEPTDTASFAACLSENDVTLYVASWATATKKEQEKFGADASDLAVVDCSAGCDDVDMFPTWKVGDELHAGSLTFEELASKSGCSLE
jgi:peptidyl-prolyl cis-trans isomerase C